MNLKSKLIVIGTVALVLGVLWYAAAMMLFTISSIVYSVAIGAGMYLVAAPATIEVLSTVVGFRSRVGKTLLMLLAVGISIGFLIGTGLPFVVVLVNYVLGLVTAIESAAGCIIAILVWQRPPPK